MQDIILNADLDFQYINGERVRGESTIQHQNLLLISNKGDFKESPTACVGIALFLKDDDKSGLLSEIKKEFERDGMKFKSVELVNNQLNIEAPYL